MNIFRRPFLGISKKAKRGVGDDVREVVRSVVAAVLHPAAVDVEGVVVEARVALQPDPLVPPGGHVLARVLVQVLAEVACGGLREKVDRRMKGRPRKFWCSGASPRSLFEVLKAGVAAEGRRPFTPFTLSEKFFLYQICAVVALPDCHQYASMRSAEAKSAAAAAVTSHRQKSTLKNQEHIRSAEPCPLRLGWSVLFRVSPIKRASGNVDKKPHCSANYLRAVSLFHISIME